MSGALSAVSSIISLVTGNAPVTLGSFTFQAFEVPDRIMSGGSQRMKAQKYAGGGRDFDAMGQDDVPVSWSGKMLGGDVLSRKSQLNELRVRGEVQELYWGNQSLDVIVKECTFTEGYGLIDYKISCEVLVVYSAGQPSLGQALLGDVGSALGLDLSGTLAAAQPILVGAQTALQAASTVLPGVGANVGLSTALGQVSGISQGASALANGNLGGLAASFTSMGQFGDLLSAAGSVANSTALTGLAGRAQALLAA